MFCNRCGFNVSSEHNYCASCGNQLRVVGAAPIVNPAPQDAYGNVQNDAQNELNRILSDEDQNGSSSAYDPNRYVTDTSSHDQRQTHNVPEQHAQYIEHGAVDNSSQITSGAQTASQDHYHNDTTHSGATSVSAPQDTSSIARGQTDSVVDHVLDDEAPGSGYMPFGHKAPPEVRADLQHLIPPEEPPLPDLLPFGHKAPPAGPMVSDEMPTPSRIQQGKRAHREHSNETGQQQTAAHEPAQQQAAHQQPAYHQESAPNNTDGSAMAAAIEADAEPGYLPFGHKAPTQVREDLRHLIKPEEPALPDLLPFGHKAPPQVRGVVGAFSATTTASSAASADNDLLSQPAHLDPGTAKVDVSAPMATRNPVSMENRSAQWDSQAADMVSGNAQTVSSSPRTEYASDSQDGSFINAAQEANDLPFGHKAPPQVRADLRHLIQPAEVVPDHLPFGHKPPPQVRTR